MTTEQIKEALERLEKFWTGKYWKAVTHEDCVQITQSFDSAMSALSAIEANASLCLADRNKRAEPVALTNDEIGRIGFDCGLRLLTTMLDEDQWANIEPRLFKFARTLIDSAQQSNPNWCDQCGRAHSKELPLYCDDCHAILASAQQVAEKEVPEGYVLVPKEPTEELMKRMHKANDSWFASDGDRMAYVYKYIISAAPQPEQKEG